MSTPTKSEKRPKHCQLVGNMGLYLVCYELSKLGWNVMPTARNARGVDIIGYSQDARHTITVQVKALSKESPAPMGSPVNWIADFLVVVRKVQSMPEYFIATMDEVRPLVHEGCNEKGEKSYWLQPKSYAQFLAGWEKVGSGFPTTSCALP